MKRAFLAAIAALSVTSALAETITPIGDLVRNSSVTVSGTVDRVTDEDEFVMSDATGSVRVYVGPNRVPASRGEAVTVRGFVDDDLRLEIYARELVRADGTVVTFDHRYD
jgi:uncharacterized protein YdeI (BOF family)